MLYKTYKRTYPKWYTSEIISNILQKSKQFDKYKKHKTARHFQEYKHLRVSITLQIENAYEIYTIKVQESSKTDPKNFWAFVQSKRKISQEIVNTFASYFQSVYSLSRFSQSKSSQRQRNSQQYFCKHK